MCGGEDLRILRRVHGRMDGPCARTDGYEQRHPMGKKQDTREGPAPESPLPPAPWTQEASTSQAIWLLCVLGINLATEWMFVSDFRKPGLMIETGPSSESCYLP